MKHRPVIVLSFILLSGLLIPAVHRQGTKAPPALKTEPSEILYQRLALASIGLKESVFRLALTGYEKLNKSGAIVKQSLLSICDFSQSSNQPRLYVIDIDRQLVLYHTLVAHGKKSGEEFANQFGNRENSHRSSLGFYITGATYTGQHGNSLCLIGQEKGFNDQAFKRGIVLHGASYVSDSFIRCNGRLGRSHGCPAIPAELSDSLVSCLQGGSCFFIYYPDSVYLQKSRLIGSAQ